MVGSVTPLTSMCLMSPKIKTELWFLVFTVYKVFSHIMTLIMTLIMKRLPHLKKPT